jgi:hypothetical protein
MNESNIEQFPIFLRSYGNLADHLNSQLDGLTSKVKGDIFARFTSKMIPITEVGIKSEFTDENIKIRQHSYDDGVDIEFIYGGPQSQDSFGAKIRQNSTIRESTYFPV